MSTTRVNLDVTQYVRVTSDPLQPSSLLLQSHRDTVRIAFSDVKPARDNTVFHELGGDNEPLNIPLTETDVWALATSDKCALTATQFKSPVTDGLSNLRVRTSSMSQAEYFSAIGKRFVVDYDEVYAGNETKYILYQMPPASSGYLVTLQQRRFKSRDADAELEILWDSTGFTPGTPLPSFNENRNFESDTGLMIVSVIAPPTTEGTIREVDFLNQIGQGNNSSGDISPETGSRIYSPDSFFIAKVTNLDNAPNRIKLAYNWAEFPISAIV